MECIYHGHEKVSIYSVQFLMHKAEIHVLIIFVDACQNQTPSDAFANVVSE